MESPFYINKFLVEPDLNRLTSPEGKVEKLEPKWMAVLCFLAQHQGNVVSKQDLMKAVWEDTVVVEKVLTRAISKLRKAFRDDPKYPQVIETVSKSGYRMIGDFHMANDREEGRTHWQNQRTILLTVFALLILALSFWHKPTRSISNYPKISPLTSFHSWEYDPAISPDGKQLAFVWNGVNKKDWNIRTDNTYSWDIYLKDLETEELRHFTDMKGSEGSPVWSSDGTHLIFYNQRRDSATLYMKSWEGDKPARKLKTILADYPTLAWSNDGKWLAYNAKDSANGSYHIHLLSLVTLESKQVTFSPEHTWGDYQPSFSNNGETLAFTQARSESLSDIFLLNLQNQELEQLTFHGANIFSHDWHDGGQSIIYSLNTNGRNEIWQIDQANKNIVKLTGGDGFSSPRISGDKLVVEQWTSITDIWKLDLGEDTTAWKAESFIQSTAWDAHPSFSPDGTQLAFASNRSGSYEIWLSDRTGKEIQKLTNLKQGFCGTPHWSPDGKILVFDWRTQGQSDIYLIDLATGELKQVTKSEKDDIAPFFAKNSTEILFTSNRDGYWRIWKQGLQEEQAMPLSQENVYTLQYAQNSKSYFQSYHDKAGIWQVFPEKDSIHLVIPNIEPADWCNWVVSENGIFFIQRMEGRNKDFIAYYNFETKETTNVYHPTFRIPNKDLSLAISPDGKTLLFGQVENTGCDLMLIDLEGF